MRKLWLADEEKEKRLFWLFFGVNIIAVLIKWLHGAYYQYPLDGWGTSEFLINFQGGYVRRGVIGEILHYLCVNTGCTPNYIILPLCLFCFVGFCLLIGIIVKKLHFCWLLLLTDYGVFGGDLIRKDYMIFLLLAAALWLYSNIRQRVLRFFAPLLIIIAILHIHEASFFYCVPVYLLIIFSDEKSAFSFAERAGQVVFITIAMGVLCHYKGDKIVAGAIINSWQAVYPETYRLLSHGSIGAIGWEHFWAFRFHIEENFINGTIPFSGFVLRPIALITILFLLVKVGLRSHLKNNVILVEKYIYISVLLVLSLTPMFTVLSCDFRRVTFYWVISSIIALYHLQNKSIFLMNTTIMQKGTEWVRNLFFVPCDKRTPYFLLLIFGIPSMGNSLVKYGPPSLNLIMKAVERITDVLS